MSRERFYFNTATGEVEEGRQSAIHLRMGPYETREEAELAYERAEDRTAAVDLEEESERQADDAWGVPPG